jgi:hypothetical protein
LTLVQDESKGHFTLVRNGASAVVLSVASRVSDATGVYEFVRWEYTTAASPTESDWAVTGSSTSATAGTHTYTTDTKYRAVWARVSATLADDSLTLGSVAVTPNPTNTRAAIVSATANEGASFDYWETSTDNGITWTRLATFTNTSTDWPASVAHSVSVSIDTIYRAHFVSGQPEWLLSVQQSEGGTATLAHNAVGVYVLTPVADPGYVLTGWQMKSPDALLWGQATWNSSDYTTLAISVNYADGNDPLVYRPRFAKLGTEVTFKPDVDAGGGMTNLAVAYQTRTSSATTTNMASLVVYPLNATTVTGNFPTNAESFLKGNLASRSYALPRETPFAVGATFNALYPDMRYSYFNSEDHEFLGFRVNGELVPAADLYAQRGTRSNVTGSLDSGNLFYMVSQYNGWVIYVSNTDIGSYISAPSYQVQQIPAGTSITGFSGDIVIELAFAHRGVEEDVRLLDGADVQSAVTTLEAVSSWSVPQSKALTQEELAAYLATQIAKLPLSGVAFEVSVTDFQPAVWGEEGVSGTDGSFGFDIALTKGFAVSPLAGLTGSITWEAKPPVSAAFALNVVPNNPAWGTVSNSSLGGVKYRLTAAPNDSYILTGWEYTPSATPAPDATWYAQPNSKDLRLQTIELEFDVTYRAIFAPVAVTLPGPSVGVLPADDTLSGFGSPYVLAAVGGITTDAHIPQYWKAGQLAPASAQIDAFDNAVLLVSLGVVQSVVAPVKVEVFAGSTATGTPLGTAAWNDMSVTGDKPYGYVQVPVDFLPNIDTVTVKVSVGDLEPVVATHPLANPPTDNGFNAQRAAAVSAIRAAYEAGRANPANQNVFGSPYIMSTVELMNAATGIAAARGADEVAEAAAHWLKVTVDTANHIYHSGVEVMMGGSTVTTLPDGSRGIAYILASYEQRYPSNWTFHTGEPYGMGAFGNFTAGTPDDKGEVTRTGTFGGTWGTTNRQCVEASVSASTGFGYGGNACEMTNGIGTQTFPEGLGGWYTPTGGSSLVTLPGGAKQAVLGAIADADPSVWSGIWYSWPGRMGWTLGELREAYPDSELITHESFVFALTHQDPTKPEYVQAFIDLRVEFLDFLFRNDPAMTDAAKAVVLAIAEVAADPDEDAAAAAQVLYDALSEAEKDVIFNYSQLLVGDDLAAYLIDQQITAIGTVAYTDRSRDLIADAAQALAGATPEVQALVTKGAQLTAAQTAFDALVDSVVGAAEDAIDAIPPAADLGPTDATTIGAAREAYDVLLATEQATFDPLRYQKLLDAEAVAADFTADPPDADAVRALTDRVAAHQLAVATAAGNLFGADEIGYDEWLILGLARGGYLDSDLADLKEQYLAGLAVRVITALADREDGRLSNSKSTDNSRIVLTLTALGVDATDFNGHDLVAALSDTTWDARQGINGAVFALLALDSGDYGDQATRDALVQIIRDSQLDDGGWALTQNTPPDAAEKATATADGDFTAMALQALAPYRQTGLIPNAGVISAIDAGLARLSALQDPVTGGFRSDLGGGLNVETAVQALVALNTLGIAVNDPLFVKSGRTVLDALEEFVIDTGAGTSAFEHLTGGVADALATYQGMYALVSLVRALDSNTALYDMSDVTLAAWPEVIVPDPEVKLSGTPNGNGDIEVFVGSTVTFTATGFTPGEQARAVVHSDPIDLGLKTVASDGSASWTWTVPDGFDLGAHTVVITSLLGRNTATAPFVVVAKPDTVTPGGGTPGNDIDEDDDTTAGGSGSGAPGSALPITGSPFTNATGPLGFVAVLALLAGAGLEVTRRRTARSKA